MNSQELHERSNTIINSLRQGKISPKKAYKNFQALSMVARTDRIPFVAPSREALQTMAHAPEGDAASSDASSESWG